MRREPTTNCDLLVKAFVHTVSTKTTTGKRFVAIRKLLSRSDLWTDQQCAHIWKGIFYAVWYTEMNKGGEELIDELASLCSSENLLIAGFTALKREWAGIDYIRIDKFMFLVRKLTLKVLRVQSANSSDLVSRILDIIMNTCGLMYHFTEIFLEEMKKVIAESTFTENSEKVDFIVKSVTPFANVMSTNTDSRTLDTISESIFCNLKRELLNEESKDIQRVVFERLIEILMSFGGKSDIKGKNRSDIYAIVKKLKSKATNVEKVDSQFKASKPLSKKRKSNCSKKAIKAKRNAAHEPKRFKRSLVPIEDE